MSVRDLLPWRRDNANPAPAPFQDNDSDPFFALHREVNRLFDNALRSLGSRPFNGFAALEGNWPSLEVSDGEKEIRIVAEMPGMDEKDIEILLSDGVLTLKGEKRSETDDKDRQYSERYYGRFERRIPLGFEVDESKVDARFDKGILTITLPKSETALSRVRRIAIKG